MLDPIIVEINDRDALAYLSAVAPQSRHEIANRALRIGLQAISEVKPEVDRIAFQDLSNAFLEQLRREQLNLADTLNSFTSADGTLESAMQQCSSKLTAALDPEHKKSPLSQTLEAVKGELDVISKLWSLDSQGSAFANLKALLDEYQSKTGQLFQSEITELRDAVLAGQVRKEEEKRGTRHGEVFETALIEAFAHLSAVQGSRLEPTGEQVGLIKNCKVGDLVITLGKEHVAANANIVVEAKQAKGYSTNKALKELATARKNRQADVGIFVLSSSHAGVAWPTFQRHGQDILMSWNAEDALTDVFLEAAFSLAAAICTERNHHANDLPDFLPMQQAVIDLEKELSAFDEIGKLTSAIQSNAEKIAARVELSSQVASRRVGDLNRCLEQLGRLSIEFIE